MAEVEELIADDRRFEGPDVPWAVDLVVIRVVEVMRRFSLERVLARGYLTESSAGLVDGAQA